MNALIFIAGVAAAAGTVLARGGEGSGLVVLHHSASGALTMSGNSHVHIPAHAVYVNSTHNQSVCTSGNAILEAPLVYLCGGSSFGGNAVCTGQIMCSNTPYADPLSGLSIPNGEGMTNYGDQSISGGSVTLSPGRYGSISISGQPHVTLEPGTYVIGGSGLSVSGQARIVGSGVTLVILSGNVSVSGQVSIQLTPPESGALAGVVLAQPPTNTSSMSLSGGSSFSMLGTIYAPQAPLTLSGQGAVEGEGPQMGDLVIGSRVTLSGQGTIKIGRPELQAIVLPKMPLCD